MLDHLGIQCADVAASAAFYDTVFAPLGGGRVMEFDEAIGYGVGRPTFWIGPLTTGDRTARSTSRSRPPIGVRACVLRRRDRRRRGALHEPRVWPEYHPTYYGAFVRDPDGNNVEAVCHPPE